MFMISETQKLMQKGGRIVLKYHNDLNVFSFGGFTQRELNLFFLICGLMKDQEDLVISFTEIKKIIGKTSFANNKELVDCVIDTNKKFLKLNGQFKRGSTLVQFVLFPTFKTNLEKQTLEVSVNPQFAYILNELTQNFTLFELQEFYSLNSTYSKHLFRLLKQYKATGVYYVTLEEFRRLLDVPEAYEMRKITDKILNPALKELANYFDNLHVEKIRQNRRIVAFRFLFTPQPSKHIASEDGTENIDMCETDPHCFRELPCPYCGKCLEKIQSTSGTFFGHKDFVSGNCRKTFSTLEDVEKAKVSAQREKEAAEKARIEAEKKAAEAARRKEIQALSLKILDFVNENPKVFDIQSMDLKNERFLLFNKIMMNVGEYPINQETLDKLQMFIESAKNL